MAGIKDSVNYIKEYVRFGSIVAIQARADKIY